MNTLTSRVDNEEIIATSTTTSTATKTEKKSSGYYLLLLGLVLIPTIAILGGAVYFVYGKKSAEPEHRDEAALDHTELDHNFSEAED